jgi:NAD(P)-dependent dehydrogenase (short-subunit alcohol dehydrogenase family)
MTNHGTSSRQLAGRVAVVSGGAQGIGRSIAARFQKEGACVFILDCDANAGQKTSAELTEENPSQPVRFLPVDLADPAQIQSAIAALRTLHERIDVLVNNAGLELDKPLEEISAPEWDRVLNVNLRGAFLLAQAVVPLFPERGGAIVNISSIHATHAFPSSIPYACSKAGMVALTRNLALELAGCGVRVNCICPGYIDTRLWEDYLRNSSNPQAIADQITDLHPLGRRGVPADVADAALFLASDGVSFITGTDLIVDGGLTIRAHP